MSSISLCMIVKNEEKNIRRCLDSVKEFVNERLIRTNMEMKSEKVQIFDGLSLKHYGFSKEVTIEQVIGNLNVLMKENEIEQENPWTLYMQKNPTNNPCAQIGCMRLH